MITQEKRKLTGKQTKFCQEYVLDLNATQAALRAGYSANCCNPIGSQNLAKVSIRDEISRLQAIEREKRGFTVEDAHKLYEHAYDVAESRGQSGAMVGASTGIARLYGMDKDSGGGREQTVIIIGPKAPVKAIESVPVASKGLLEGEAADVDGQS